jgi:hypothetical protein
MAQQKFGGLFGDDMFNLGGLPDREQEDDARAWALAQDPDRARAYTAYSGASMAGRGLGTALGALGGYDVRSQEQVKRDAMARVRAAVANLDKNDVEAYYGAMAQAFRAEGMEREAIQLETMLDQRKAQRSANELREAQSKRYLAQSRRDDQDAKLRDIYNETLDKIEAQGEFVEPGLIAKRDALERRLGIKSTAPKIDSPWKLVPPTQDSPGYRYNSQTGEYEALDGRFQRPVKPGKDAPAAAGADDPFAGLSPDARRAAEREAGKSSAQWIGGDRASALRGVEALRDIQARLSENPDLVNDPVSSQWLPDWLRSTMPSGAAAIDARDVVRLAVQASLKATLGAQFTEKEAQQLFERAYDPRLGAEENIERLERAIIELQDKIDARDDLSRGRRPAERPIRAPRSSGKGGSTGSNDGWSIRKK